MSLGHVQAQDNNTDRQTYIDTYKELAISEMVRTGVPASITLAQGILESKAGTSKLAQYSNNHFGIKCKTEWTGDRIFQDDDEKGECFRVYRTAEESFRDHSDFLKNRPYYTSLFTLDPTDYKSWASGLKKAGYATEKNYAAMLVTLIEKYHLEDYSDIALQKINNPSTPEVILTKNENTQHETATQPTGYNQKPNVQPTHQPIVTVATITTQQETVAYPATVFAINNTKVLYVQPGTSLFALASNYGISYNKLLEYNELENADILTRPRLIFLAKKPKKGDKEYHVTINETLDDIAQKEGIQLTSLALYNHLSKNARPADGEKVFLRGDAPTTPKVWNTDAMAKNL